MRTQMITQALQDWKEFQRILPVLTEDEVLHALDLEAGSTRRVSHITRLIQRAVRLNEVNYSSTLRERYLK